MTLEIDTCPVCSGLYVLRAHYGLYCPTCKQYKSKQGDKMTLSEALTASPIGEAIQVVGIRHITVERYCDLTVTIEFPGGEGKPQKWYRITQGSAEWSFKHMIPHYKPAGWEPKQEVAQIETFVSWTF